MDIQQIRRQDSPIMDLAQQQTSYKAFLINRLSKQWIIFKYRKWYFFLFFIIDFWCAVVIFRNLAFLRFPVGQRLKDLGFQIFPQYNRGFTNLPLYILITMGSSTCLLSLYKRNGRYPYAINAIFRGLSVMTVGHFLRILTYISTSLPGSADYCLKEKNPHIQQDKPKTLFEIFFKTKADVGQIEKGLYNCGDLTYSGHLVSVFVCAFIINRYLPMHFNIASQNMCLIRISILILIIIQCVLIIMARHHYTIDIVIAIYVMPLIWYWHSSYVPKDINPQNFQECD